MNMKFFNSKPLIMQRADPYVYHHTDGWYYFTASHPDYDKIELRRSRTIAGLAAPDEMRIIWTRHDDGDMSEHIWAPELHFIDGVWYIYFTASMRKDKWKVRPYVMSCEDADPVMGNWHENGRIDVGEDTFSLDMTTFEHRGRRYMIWAHKPTEQEGSCLYMASAKSPLELNDDAFILSRPEYDWECRGFKVNEGPAVLIRNGKVIVTYSASDTGIHYCMGMLWADVDADLTDPASWNKSYRPVLVTDIEKEIYGPGHNSFTTENGHDVLIFHARSYPEVKGDPLYDPNRHTYAAEFGYDGEGLPVFSTD